MLDGGHERPSAEALAMTEHAASSEFELLLRRALSPVEPPEDLSQRLESTLQSLTDLAVEELDSWELGAMRDPRNWARPAAAAAIGTTAGAALVVLRVRSQHKKRRAQSQSRGELAERTLKALADEARKLLDR
jgi:hypothetical protein